MYSYYLYLYLQIKCTKYIFLAHNLNIIYVRVILLNIKLNKSYTKNYEFNSEEFLIIFNGPWFCIPFSLRFHPAKYRFFNTLSSRLAFCTVQNSIRFFKQDCNSLNLCQFSVSKNRNKLNIYFGLKLT